MHRLVLTFLFLAAIFGDARAQLADEWLRQDKTQRKYLGLQIAALKQYLSAARSGYEIVSGGIRTIGQIKRGDLEIHSAYFSSLKRVSPFVRRHEKVLTLTSSYVASLQHCQRMETRWKNVKALPDWKRAVLEDTYSLFVDDVAGDLLALAGFIADGCYELNDEERLIKIDELGERQTERNVRLRRLSAEFAQQAEASVRNQKAILHLHKLLP